MTVQKNIFLDENLRCGGFYELAIQVCPSTNSDPIDRYLDYIWALDIVSGPFDEDFNLTGTNPEIIHHSGLVKLDHLDIPFATINIRETEPIETGFNWFVICFYSAAIEHVFGSEYKTWTESPRVPEAMTNFFTKILKDLYNVFPFELAILDFEVSGQYYLEDLAKPLNNNWANYAFYVGQKNYHLIAIENRRFAKCVEEI